MFEGGVIFGFVGTSFFHGKADHESYTDKMKKRIDSPEGRILYGRRFATVEPVFGNLRYNKGLDRFTLRGKKQSRCAVEIILPGA